MKICFRCKKEIEEKQNYFEIIERDNAKEVRSDFVHKYCWNKFLQQLEGAKSTLVKSNYLLDVIGKRFRDMGIIPEEKEEVQIV